MGRFQGPTCSNYVSTAIRFILDLPEKGKKQAEEFQSALTLTPTEATPVPLLTRPGECSHPTGQGEEPLALATRNPEELTPQADPNILCQEESDHLTAQAARAKQKVSIKVTLLNQLAQLKITVEELDTKGEWKAKWQASQREVRKTQRRLVESEKTITEKIDAITALTDFYKANERHLRGERDLARENSQAEQQAQEELQSKWIKEKAEFEEQLLLHEQKFATMNIEMKTLLNQSRTREEGMRIEMDTLKKKTMVLEDQLRETSQKSTSIVIPSLAELQD